MISNTINIPSATWCRVQLLRMASLFPPFSTPLTKIRSRILTVSSIRFPRSITERNYPWCFCPGVLLRFLPLSIWRVGNSIIFIYFLVGGFNPIEKYSQNGNLPQIGMNIKHIWNHHLVLIRIKPWIFPRLLLEGKKGWTEVRKELGCLVSTWISQGMCQCNGTRKGIGNILGVSLTVSKVGQGIPLIFVNFYIVHKYFVTQSLCKQKNILLGRNSHTWLFEYKMWNP